MCLHFLTFLNTDVGKQLKSMEAKHRLSYVVKTVHARTSVAPITNMV